VIVLVGSTRPAKVDGTREALEAIGRLDSRFAAFSLESHDLTHIAPRQPLSLEEILDGAVGRATALLRVPSFQEARVPRFAVGVEGGLHEVIAGAWSLQTWAAVTDGTRWGYGSGPAIVLPGAVVERVHRGEELGDVIDGLAGNAVRGTRGAWGVLTHDLIGRRDAFRLAVLAAFARFYNARAWGG
jgi:inosine/xanthosine triphosphatase